MLIGIFLKKWQPMTGLLYLELLNKLNKQTSTF